MSRSLFTVLTAVSFLAACGTKSSEGSTDPNAPKAEVIPKVPRVMGFEAGRGLDSMKLITGGIRTTFSPTDTIDASVMTENVGLGAKIEVKLMSDTTTIAKVEALTTAADTSGRGAAGLKIGPSKPWKVGKYQLMVFLDGKMQMGKELEITKSGEPESEVETKAPAKAPAAKAPTKTPPKTGTKAGGGGEL